jgi:predicted protein tyrosine phosphatase
MKLLFVCSFGKNRSRTAAELFGEKGHDTDYAGLCSASRPVTPELLEWADIIFVFESAQAEELKAMWPDKQPINLSIGSHYGHGDGALKRLILERAGSYLD